MQVPEPPMDTENVIIAALFKAAEVVLNVFL